MERRKNVWLGVFLIFAFLLMPFAARAEMKIGVVNLQKALNQSERGKKAKEELRAEFEKKSREIEAKKAEVEALRRELQKKASLLSAKAKKAKEEEYRAKLRELKHAIDDAKAELATKENEMSAQILKDLVEMVRRKGRTEEYSLILEVNGGVIYAAPSLDITGSVIKAFDSYYGRKSSGRAGKGK